MVVHPDATALPDEIVRVDLEFPVFVSMPLLSDAYLHDAVAFRRQLHAHPELSGQEAATAKRVQQALAVHRPDQIHTGVGGHGVLAVFDSGKPGPTVVFRCELDALPIDEPNEFSHRSTRRGISHKCGHDGHSATMVALAGVLREHGVPRGKVVLLFQPAEETGEGARSMLADSRIRALDPSLIFAVHNLPKFPMHQVIVKDGVFACASAGIAVRFTGSSTHSSYPEHGRSPALAVARLIESLPRLADTKADPENLTLVTVTQATLGETARKIEFGIAPATGSVMAVLRAARQTDLDSLQKRAVALAERLAAEQGVAVEIDWHDEFASTQNDARAVALVREAAGRAGLAVAAAAAPFRWSEDFGLFLEHYPGAIFGLGAGEECPQLHNERYDFPDELIPTGVAAYWALIEEILAGNR